MSARTGVQMSSTQQSLNNTSIHKVVVVDDLACIERTDPTSFPVRTFCKLFHSTSSSLTCFLDRCETSIVNHRPRRSNGGRLHEIEPCHATSHNFPCREMASVACSHRLILNPAIIPWCQEIDVCTTLKIYSPITIPLGNKLTLPLDTTFRHCGRTMNFDPGALLKSACFASAVVLPRDLIIAGCTNGLLIDL